MAGERAGFVADALHQIAVAGDDIGAVIDQPIAEARVENPLRQRHADGIAETLAQGTGRRLDARRVAVFGMPGAGTAELPEALDVVERDPRIAGQIQQRIEQHRPVTRGEHEAVAVGPIRVGRRRISGWRVNSTVAASAMPIGMPGWPLFAASTASIASARIAFAIRRTPSRFSVGSGWSGAVRRRLGRRGGGGHCNALLFRP